MHFRRWKFARALARPVPILGLVLAAAFAPTGCRNADVAGPTSLITTADVPDSPDDAEVPLALTGLTARTYDGSGEFVHPDAYVFPTPWHGHRYWYVATPYPSGNSAFENPSLFLRSGPATWDALAGLTNPLARPEAGAYLSDPDLQYDDVRDELRLYFRQTTKEHDQLFVVTSGDGSTWGAPRKLLEDAKYSLISPAVARSGDGAWNMWTVDASAGGCRTGAAQVSLTRRRSSDGLSWEARTPVRLTIPHFVPWHWDVQYIRARNEYWTLVAAYPDGSNCSYTSVFFGRSADGSTWRMSPTPLLAPGALPAVRDLVYRSTFHYHSGSDAVSVWFSGARLDLGSYVYGGAEARFTLNDLLQRVEQPLGDQLSARNRARTDPPSVLDSVARAAFVDAFP